MATKHIKQRLLLVLIVSVTVFTAIAATRVTYRRFELARELSGVEEKISELQQEREKLTEQVASFEDLATIERAAREVLNLQRAGEQVVILLPSGEEIVTGGEEEPVPGEAPEPSNPVKWWGYFFGEDEG